MRAMAKDLASLAGGWQYGQPGEVLYNAAVRRTTGCTTTWAWRCSCGRSGRRRAAAPGFFPTYSCQASTFWPKTKPMLMYAAKKAASPYGGGGNPPVGCAKATNDADVAIPDAGAAVTSPIAVSGVTGNAPATLKVDVNIVHTYRGDLVIDLIAPDGTAYRLKSVRTTTPVTTSITTYTADVSSEVAQRRVAAARAGRLLRRHRLPELVEPDRLTRSHGGPARSTTGPRESYLSALSNLQVQSA